MVTKECYSCRYRGTLGGIELSFCCDYAWITGHCRTAMKRRADGKCPAYEEGERYRVEVWPMDRPFRTVVIKGRGFTHAELLEMYNKGMTDGEIAREIGAVKSTIYQWRHRNNLPAQAKARENLPNYDYARFRELWEQGLSDMKIARACDCSPATVSRWRTMAGLPSKGISGTPPIFDREKMRELYDKGLGDEAIAREIGCNKSTISKWREREDLPAHGW